MWLTVLDVAKIVKLDENYKVYWIWMVSDHRPLPKQLQRVRRQKAHSTRLKSRGKEMSQEWLHRSLEVKGF